MRWWWCALFMSCGYKIKLTSDPMPAEILLPNGQTVYTPADVTFKWIPFNKQEIVVSAPGYRSVSINLRKREIRAARYISDTLFHPSTLLGNPRGEVRVVLTPNHGPAGTWDLQAK